MCENRLNWLDEGDYLEMKWNIRFCRHRWDRRLGLRVWRRWWRSCFPGRNFGCLWSASCRPYSFLLPSFSSLLLLSRSLFVHILTLPLSLVLSTPMSLLTRLPALLVIKFNNFGIGLPLLLKYHIDTEIMFFWPTIVNYCRIIQK